MHNTWFFRVVVGIMTVFVVLVFGNSATEALQNDGDDIYTIFIPIVTKQPEAPNEWVAQCPVANPDAVACWEGQPLGVVNTAQHFFGGEFAWMDWNAPDPFYYGDHTRTAVLSWPFPALEGVWDTPPSGCHLLISFDSERRIGDAGAQRKFTGVYQGNMVETQAWWQSVLDAENDGCSGSWRTLVWGVSSNSNVLYELVNGLLVPVAEAADNWVPQCQPANPEALDCWPGTDQPMGVVNKGFKSFGGEFAWEYLAPPFHLADGQDKVVVSWGHPAVWGAWDTPPEGCHMLVTFTSDQMFGEDGAMRVFTGVTQDNLVEFINWWESILQQDSEGCSDGWRPLVWGFYPDVLFELIDEDLQGLAYFSFDWLPQCQPANPNAVTCWPGTEQPIGVVGTELQEFNGVFTWVTPVPFEVDDNLGTVEVFWSYPAIWGLWEAIEGCETLVIQSSGDADQQFGANQASRRFTGVYDHNLTEFTSWWIGILDEDGGGCAGDWQVYVWTGIGEPTSIVSK